EEGKVGITIMSMSQDDVDRVLSLPYCAVISDSLYGGGDSPHPRLYGSFPRVIREYVNERHIMNLAQAIHKMTGMPAARVGLKDRGLIREGYAADLNVFDPAKIRDTATYTQPKQLAAGIDYTLLAGQIAARDNIKEEESFGRLLRKQ
ncbi:MAG TPA: N-acyl-D-aspartate deacylase, partial [Lachnospiraceae bacterium]|nr:N-acyl-D-aspartate deacylase [Lachnospiraceae bacterium]